MAWPYSTDKTHCICDGSFFHSDLHVQHVNMWICIQFGAECKNVWTTWRNLCGIVLSFSPPLFLFFSSSLSWPSCAVVVVFVTISSVNKCGRNNWKTRQSFDVETLLLTNDDLKCCVSLCYSVSQSIAKWRMKIRPEEIQMITFDSNTKDIQCPIHSPLDFRIFKNCLMRSDSETVVIWALNLSNWVVICKQIVFGRKQSNGQIILLKHRCRQWLFLSQSPLTLLCVCLVTFDRTQTDEMICIGAVVSCVRSFQY